MPQRSALSVTQCDHDAIAAVVAALRGRWPVERVILFGSKARGDDEPDSDIDLLVITAQQLERQSEDAMQDAAWEIGLAHGRCVQMIAGLMWQTAEGSRTTEPVSTGDDERDGLAKGGMQPEKTLLERVWRGHRASRFWRSSSKMRARTCSAVSLSRFSPDASSR